MKKLMTMLLLISLNFYGFAQRIKVKTSYSYEVVAKEITKQIEQKDYYDTLGNLIKTETFSPLNIEADVFKNSLPLTQEIFMYNAAQKLDSSLLKIREIGQQEFIISSTCKYFYLPKQAVKKISYTKGILSGEQNYSLHNNGTKLFSRYNYKFNKQNNIVEMKLANNAKNRTLFFYNKQNLKIKEQQFQGKKKMEETLFTYNNNKQLIQEQIKTLSIVPIEILTINYEYQENLLIKETTQVDEQEAKSIYYEYQFW